MQLQEQYKMTLSLVFMALALSLTACHSRGFEVKNKALGESRSGRIASGQVEFVTLDSSDPQGLLDQVSHVSPEAGGLSIQPEQLNVKAADMILGLDVQQTQSTMPEDPVQIEIRAVLKKDDVVTEHMGGVAIAGDEIETIVPVSNFKQMRLVQDVTSDTVLSTSDTHVSVYCTSGCQQVFVDLKLTSWAAKSSAGVSIPSASSAVDVNVSSGADESQVKAQAYFVFVQTEPGRYKLHSSSLGDRYRSVDQALAELSAKSKN